MSKRKPCLYCSRRRFKDRILYKQTSYLVNKIPYVDYLLQMYIFTNLLYGSTIQDFEVVSKNSYIRYSKGTTQILATSPFPLILVPLVNTNLFWYINVVFFISIPPQSLLSSTRCQLKQYTHTFPSRNLDLWYHLLKQTHRISFADPFRIYLHIFYNDSHQPHPLTMHLSKQIRISHTKSNKQQFEIEIRFGGFLLAINTKL